MCPHKSAGECNWRDSSGCAVDSDGTWCYGLHLQFQCFVNLHAVTAVLEHIMKELGCCDGSEKQTDHLAVDDFLRKLELVNHAKGNGTTAGLAVVHLALEHISFHVFLLQCDIAMSKKKQNGLMRCRHLCTTKYDDRKLGCGWTDTNWVVDETINEQHTHNRNVIRPGRRSQQRRRQQGRRQRQRRASCGQLRICVPSWGLRCGQHGLIRPCGWTAHWEGWHPWRPRPAATKTNRQNVSGLANRRLKTDCVAQMWNDLDWLCHTAAPHKWRCMAVRCRTPAAPAITAMAADFAPIVVRLLDCVDRLCFCRRSASVRWIQRMGNL